MHRCFGERGKRINRLALLFPMILACSSPLRSHPPDGGSSGGGGAGNVGASSGSGGSGTNGGAGGVGHSSATGGVTGTGGSVSAAGGSSSATDLDTCSTDADCTSCNWETAPANSGQCTGFYCCGGMITTSRKCEANQAAWTHYCPNQFPTQVACPCVMLCPEQVVACVGGRCVLRCPPLGDAGPDTPLLGRDGASPDAPIINQDASPDGSTARSDAAMDVMVPLASLWRVPGWTCFLGKAMEPSPPRRTTQLGLGLGIGID